MTLHANQRSHDAVGGHLYEYEFPIPQFPHVALDGLCGSRVIVTTWQLMGTQSSQRIWHTHCETSQTVLAAAAMVPNMIRAPGHGGLAIEVMRGTRLATTLISSLIAAHISSQIAPLGNTDA